MEFIYSQLASESVLKIIESNFVLETPFSVKFYVRGLHDNYLIECRQKKYIFRLYRNTWRTKEEILFEVDLLLYLEKTSSQVAAPIKTINNESIISIATPEGARIAVLFNYAEGAPPSSHILTKECNLLGVSVANIHENTNKFESKYHRETLDLTYLVDHSLHVIKPFINRKQQFYLAHIKKIIDENISHLSPDNSDFGICTGDINLTNFHINENDIITHFDFDQCGYGFRAFEIGKFTVGFRKIDFTHDNIRAFVDGYESIRSLSETEKLSILYFEIVSIIWVMSIHVANVDKIGYQYLDEDFWQKRIGIIEKLESNLIGYNSPKII